jgi:hypothetical protein
VITEEIGFGAAAGALGAWVLSTFGRPGLNGGDLAADRRGGGPAAEALSIWSNREESCRIV